MNKEGTLPIGESELILKPDGSIYHLNLHPDELADTVILVGDPGRVPVVSAYFDRVDVKKKNREITTHTGELNGIRLSVLSTGMGSGNMDVVMNEINALASIDLNTRQRLSETRTIRLIRLGTSGGLHKSLPVDSFVASRYAVGMDGILQFYKQSGGLFNQELADSFEDYMSWPAALAKPYAAEGSSDLIEQLAHDMQQGITLTALGFYAPQGRVLNGQLAFPSLHSKMQGFAYNGYPVMNLEMETSSLYGFSSIFGYEALSICAVIANRVDKSFSLDYKATVKRLIETTLERLVS